MNAPSYADSVMQRINGGNDARRLLNVLREGCAPADALHEAVQAVRATGEPEREVGFLRQVQKELERRG